MHAAPAGPPAGLTLEIIRQALQSGPRTALRGSGMSREAQLLTMLKKSHALAFMAQESRLNGLTLMQISLVKQLVKREGGSAGCLEGDMPAKPQLVAADAKVSKRKPRAVAVATGALELKTNKRKDKQEALVDIRKQDSAARQHFCYALYRPGLAGGAAARPDGSRHSGRTTYIGYTVDPARRLRQHNGLISGGAAGTRGGRGSWCFLFIVTVDPLPPPSDAALSTGACSDSTMPFRMHEGLSLEWHLKRRGRRGSKKTAKKSGKGTGKELATSSPDTPASMLLASLPTVIAHRIERLKDALQHRKFQPFSSRFIVYVTQDHIDVMREVLSGLPCRVQPLTDLLLPPD